MAVRVRPQASTKWWVLLAMVLAIVCTLIQHRGELTGERARPAPPVQGDVVEFEIVAE